MCIFGRTKLFFTPYAMKIICNNRCLLFIFLYNGGSLDQNSPKVKHVHFCFFVKIAFLVPGLTFPAMHSFLSADRVFVELKTYLKYPTILSKQDYESKVGHVKTLGEDWYLGVHFND